MKGANSVRREVIDYFHFPPSEADTLTTALAMRSLLCFGSEETPSNHLNPVVAVTDTLAIRYRSDPERKKWTAGISHDELRQIIREEAAAKKGTDLESKKIDSRVDSAWRRYENEFRKACSAMREKITDDIENGKVSYPYEFAPYGYAGLIAEVRGKHAIRDERIRPTFSFDENGRRTARGACLKFIFGREEVLCREAVIEILFTERHVRRARRLIIESRSAIAGIISRIND